MNLMNLKDKTWDKQIYKLIGLHRSDLFPNQPIPTNSILNTNNQTNNPYSILPQPIQPLETIGLISHKLVDK